MPKTFIVCGFEIGDPHPSEKPLLILEPVAHDDALRIYWVVLIVDREVVWRGSISDLVDIVIDYRAFIELGG